MIAPNLELKIPPVLVTVIFALLMWFIDLLLPAISIPRQSSLAGAVAMACLGAFLALAGVASFKKARTTVNPLTPGSCSALVTSGIYSRTRNPMYLGLFFLLMAWGLFLSSLYSLAFCAGFILYMNRFQIQAEEKSLESLFGAGFLTYKERVRRWL